jgi:putative ABC transport system ATP-binding protein
MNENIPAIDVRDVVKSFDEGRIQALRGATLPVAPGEGVAIMGPSGCGKSTLLHLIAALDEPTDGQIRVNGKELGAHSSLSRYRAREIGLVFQMHNLLPTLSAEENVQMPMFEADISPRERRSKARELLDRVGLSGKYKSLPTRLSGGERQRVAIARALANDPPILLADEPTGNLDSLAGLQVLDLLERLRRERQLTIVMVTHDDDVAAHADRIVRMLDGRVSSSESTPRRQTPTSSATLTR